VTGWGAEHLDRLLICIGAASAMASAVMLLTRQGLGFGITARRLANMVPRVTHAGKPSGLLSKVIPTMATAAGGLVLGMAAGGVAGAAVGTCLASWARGHYLRHKQAARIRAFQEAFPNALLALGACLRSGQSLLQAIEALTAEGDGPVVRALQGVLDEYRTGVPLLTALGRLEGDFPGEEVRYFLQALEAHRLSGGNLAEVLAGAATALHERRMLVGEFEAKTQEARVSARVLLALPVVLGLYFAWANPEMLRPLWETTTGRLGAAYGLASWLIGRELMARMVRTLEL